MAAPKKGKIPNPITGAIFFIVVLVVLFKTQGELELWQGILLIIALTVVYVLLTMLFPKKEQK